MRIHELIEMTPDQYLLEFANDLKLDELSWYSYRRPAVKPQLRRALQVVGKTSTKSKKKLTKPKPVGKRVARVPSRTVQSMAQKQLVAQRQKQASQSKYQSAQNASPYAPIKYSRQLIRNQLPAQQQQDKTPVPPSISTQIAGIGDLKKLGAQAQMILPKSERGTPVWDINNP